MVTWVAVVSLGVSGALAASGHTLQSATPLATQLQMSIDRLQADQLQQQADVGSGLIVQQKKERNTEAGLPKAATGSLTVSVDGRDVELSDVPLQSWYAPYVRTAAAANLLGGYRDAAGNPVGTFGPSDPVTIAELAKISILAAHIDPSSCADSTNPKAKTQWFSRVLGCAETRHWVLYGEATVNPLRPATRAEVVVTLLQAFNVAPAQLSDESGPFTDVTFSTQYAGSIARAKNDGLVRGYVDAAGNLTGFFGPQDNVTRAEAAKMLVTAVEKYAQ